MTVSELQKAIWVKRCVGLLVAVISVYWLLLSVLHGIWLMFNSPSSSSIFQGLADQVVLFYSLVTLGAPFYRMVTPVNFQHYLSASNLIPLAVYIIFLLGGMLFHSANAQGRMIARAKKRKNEKDMDRALNGDCSTSVELGTVKLPSPQNVSWVDSISIHFLWPLAVTVGGGLILKFLGAT